MEIEHTVPVPPLPEKAQQILKTFKPREQPVDIKQLLKDIKMDEYPVEMFRFDADNILRIAWRNAPPMTWYEQHTLLAKFERAYDPFAMKEILLTELAAGRVPIDLPTVLKGFDINNSATYTVLMGIAEELGMTDPNKRHDPIKLPPYKAPDVA
jgi:hypothetical protein